MKKFSRALSFVMTLAMMLSGIAAAEQQYFNNGGGGEVVDPHTFTKPYAVNEVIVPADEATGQVALEAHVKNVIEVDGLKFKDLNGNGTLDVYEDWRQPVDARVDDLLSGSENQRALRTEIMSFGYKRGIPREADLVFDVRFLPNPYYIKDIRAYTGLEAPVRDFVLGKEETREFLGHLYELVDYLLPLYQREGKRRLMIAVGCTGGAHRSVAISEALGAHLRALGQTVSVTHRDISIEEASWPFRRVK